MENIYCKKTSSDDTKLNKNLLYFLSFIKNLPLSKLVLGITIYFYSLFLIPYFVYYRFLPVELTLQFLPTKLILLSILGFLITLFFLFFLIFGAYMFSKISAEKIYPFKDRFSLTFLVLRDAFLYLFTIMFYGYLLFQILTNFSLILLFFFQLDPLLLVQLYNFIQPYFPVVVLTLIFLSPAIIYAFSIFFLIVIYFFLKKDNEIFKSFKARLEQSFSFLFSFLGILLITLSMFLSGEFSKGNFLLLVVYAVYSILFFSFFLHSFRASKISYIIFLLLISILYPLIIYITLPKTYINFLKVAYSLVGIASAPTDTALICISKNTNQYIAIPEILYYETKLDNVSLKFIKGDIKNYVCFVNINVIWNGDSYVWITDKNDTKPPIKIPKSALLNEDVIYLPKAKENDQNSEEKTKQTSKTKI